MPKPAPVPSLVERLPATHAAPSLMDDLQFMAELETMEAVPTAPSLPAQLLEHARTMEDGFVAGQPRLHVHPPAQPHTRRPSTITITRDRNTFQSAAPEPDEEFDEYQHDDETSVTISARGAAFAITAAGLAGAGAAALVFHARLAQILSRFLPLA